MVDFNWVVDQDYREQRLGDPGHCAQEICAFLSVDDEVSDYQVFGADEVFIAQKVLVYSVVCIE